MKPIKSLAPFATWLMRLALGILIFIIFIPSVEIFMYNSLNFYVAAGFLLFSGLLFIGGFLKKPGVTILSSLMLFLLSAYKIFVNFSVCLSHQLAVFILVAAVSLLFLSTGNKS